MKTYFLDIIYDKENKKTFGLDINYDYEDEVVIIFWSSKIEDENFLRLEKEVGSIKELISSLLDKKDIGYDFELSQFETNNNA